MRNTTVQPVVSFGVRLPPQVYTMVKTMADEHKSSVNAMVQAILEEALRIRMAKQNKKQNSER